ncbi:MAG: esterase-like activity of phytase family protein [Phyllobacterium sp.]
MRAGAAVFLSVRCLVSGLVPALPPSALAQENGVETVEVRAYPIAQFRVGSDETRFGIFEFVGGFEMRGSNDHFGGFSGLRFLDAGENFLGVSDSGFWYAGDIARDARGRPVGVGHFRMAPLLGADGLPVYGKADGDAESLAVAGDTAIVGFERNHRLEAYPIDTGNFASRPKALPLPVPAYELRNNRSFETVAVAPADSPLAGATVTVTEKSLNPAGDVFAAVTDGPRKGIFYVRRSDEFDISDGDFLPDGDLLLLERRFSLASGIAFRLRRIPAEDIRPGATVEGEIVLGADMQHQIDNMEGLSVWQDADGIPHISLISDNNQSILQRTIYLEFRLGE